MLVIGTFLAGYIRLLLMTMFHVKSSWGSQVNPAAYDPPGTKGWFTGILSIDTPLSFASTLIAPPPPQYSIFHPHFQADDLKQATAKLVQLSCSGFVYPGLATFHPRQTSVDRSRRRAMLSREWLVGVEGCCCEC